VTRETFECANVLVIVALRTFVITIDARGGHRATFDSAFCCDTFPFAVSTARTHHFPVHDVFLVTSGGRRDQIVTDVARGDAGLLVGEAIGTVSDAVAGRIHLRAAAGEANGGGRHAIPLSVSPARSLGRALHEVALLAGDSRLSFPGRLVDFHIAVRNFRWRATVHKFAGLTVPGVACVALARRPVMVTSRVPVATDVRERLVDARGLVGLVLVAQVLVYP
jgi:hypothetical protein